MVDGGCVGCVSMWFLEERLNEEKRVEEEGIGEQVEEEEEEEEEEKG